MNSTIKKLALKIPDVKRIYEELTFLRNLNLKTGISGLEEDNCLKFKDNVNPPSKKMNLLKSFEDLDRFIEICAKKGQAGLSLNEQRAFWGSYQLDHQSFIALFGKLPPSESDPFSEAYSSWVMSFFEFVSGKKYSFDSEGNISNDKMDKPLAVTFDFDYRMWHMRVYTDFVKIVRPQYGTRVLEMGCGFGHLVAFMERLGCEVTALDASKSMLNFINKKYVSEQNVKVNLIHGSYYDIEDYEGYFDVIVFESSFHHCGEPVRLLEILRKKLSQNGRLFFLNEPILSSYDAPWGIRYDGESIMQIRKNGWLELGYRLDFFEELLSRTGFHKMKTHTLHDGGVFLFETSSIS